VGTALVVENDPTDDARLLGTWLTEAGLELATVRPHAGDDLPATLDGYQALVVLGGEQNAYPGPGGEPGAPWFEALEGLLRKAVRHRVPTLALCLGAQLLATAHNGVVESSPSGPEIGARLVAKRDAAESDPLFARVPMTPDVFQWHHDEITQLPVGAVLLAASTYYPHQAFRLGPVAWGLQFHIECDEAMVAGWAAESPQLLAELGIDPDDLIAATAAVLVDIEEAWQPFVARFAMLALGELSAPGVSSAGRRTLPLLGQ
jgi:GMP synthase-like glutamine amidotransferase